MSEEWLILYVVDDVVMVRAIYYFGFGKAYLSQHPTLVGCRRERRWLSLSVLLLSVFMGQSGSAVVLLVFPS